MASIQALNGIRIAQIISIPTAGFLSGMIACMSVAGIPAVALAPAEIAAKQWKKIYDIGSTTMPPVVVVTAACFGFLASQTGGVAGLFPRLSFDPTQPRVLYSVATLLLPSIIPYTIAFMKPTNDIIMARAVSGMKSAATDAQIATLLQKWSGLNYVRAVLVGAGALLAATATVITLYNGRDVKID